MNILHAEACCGADFLFFVAGIKDFKKAEQHKPDYLTQNIFRKGKNVQFKKVYLKDF